MQNNKLELNDLFISYHTKKSIKQLVLKFHETLLSCGYRIAISFNSKRTGLLEENQINGIEASTLFICCVSYSYIFDKNCLLELKYAKKLNKNIMYVVFDNINKMTRHEVYKKYSSKGFSIENIIYFKYNQMNEVLRFIQCILVRIVITYNLIKRRLKGLDGERKGLSVSIKYDKLKVNLK
jgi:hypothetical protein